jgi:hypothetical protein
MPLCVALDQILLWDGVPVPLPHSERSACWLTSHCSTQPLSQLHNREEKLETSMETSNPCTWVPSSWLKSPFPSSP